MARPALEGLTVLELAEGIAGPFCTRLLASFGAEVIKLEPPDSGDWTRLRGPFLGDTPGAGRSLLFAYLNANKRSLALDLATESGQRLVGDLAGTVDIVVESTPAGLLDASRLAPESLRARNPGLVVTSLPMFERGSRYERFEMTELNVYAMSGLMSLVGGLGRPPLKAGGYQAQYMAGLHACALTLFAAFRARRDGTGCWIDTSIVESAARMFTHMADDSAQAAAGERPDERRERANHILRGRDGFMAVMLYYYQMKELGELLGIPSLAADARFTSPDTTRSHESELRREVERWLATRSGDEVEREAQARHLLFSRVNTTRDLSESEHLRARGFFRKVSGPGPGQLEYPGPPFSLSDSPPVAPGPAPALGEANRYVLRARPSEQLREVSAPGRTEGLATGLPLDGVRVLDLTHRLAGPTMTMLFGDWGADVLKLEWWHRMDAWRGMISVEHDRDGRQLYNQRPGWLKLNRNKRGITLNLKHETGKELFRKLAAQSDVVADNFSAGVLERLGLGYEALSAINPRIIMISMPGFGNSGPHAGYVSNGATMEGYAGLASLTGYEDGIPRNSVSIWPDPVAGVHGAVAVAMALLQRETTGRGQYIELSQADALINMIGESLLDYSANGRVQAPIGNSDPEMAPHGVYPCAGDDRWITIAVTSDAAWAALCGAAGRRDWAEEPRYRSLSGRLASRPELDEQIARWTAGEEAWGLAARLQEASVAAAPVATIDDLGPEAHALSRRLWQTLDHPRRKHYPGLAARHNGREPVIRRGPPDLGAHTDEVYSELLGLPADDLRRLRADGVI